ncbi:carboxymuconolactone decarboxylase family protein, partial [Amycolatopsis sp.]
MPHIPLDPQLPGIRSLMAFRPETAVPLNHLAQTLLRGPGSLTVGERELIAAVVSNGNECRFCHGSHAAAAAETLDG